MTELTLLTLICRPDLEERVLDRLLMSCPQDLFTSQSVACHGAAHHGFAPVEQVLGRQQMVQVQILLPVTVMHTVLAELRTEFAGVGLRYWLSAITAAGEIL